MTDEADKGVETELKFAIDAADLPALRAHPIFAGVADRRELLEATYFDTPDCLLHEAGFSLRLRRSGETVTQTLKGKRPGGSGFLHRDEHEHVVADGRRWPRPCRPICCTAFAAGWSRASPWW